MAETAEANLWPVREGRQLELSHLEKMVQEDPHPPDDLIKLVAPNFLFGVFKRPLLGVGIAPRVPSHRSHSGRFTIKA